MSEFFMKKIRNPLIFWSMLLLIFIMLITSILLVQKLQYKNLQTTVSKFLTSNYPDKFELGLLDKNISLTNSSKIIGWNIKYKAESSKDTYYLLLSRVTTICGPQPLVFILHLEDLSIEYLGIIGTSMKNNSIRNGITNTTILQCQKDIIKLFTVLNKRELKSEK